MEQKSFYKYLDKQGAILTLANKNFCFAKPSQYKDIIILPRKKNKSQN